MSDKKHIDRIFQEKFKDFEVTPNNAVWDGISKKLKPKKDDKKVIPIWWKLAGVAAVLLLLLTVGNLISDDSNNNNSNVVETENIEDNNKTDIEKNNNTVVENDSKVKNLEKTNINLADKNLNNLKEANQSSNQNNKVANSNKLNQHKNQINLKSNSNNFNSQKTSKSNIQLVNTQTKDNSSENKSLEGSLNKINESIIDKNKEVIAESKSGNNEIIDKNISEEIINSKTEEQIVSDEEKEKLALTEEVIASNINEEEKEAINRWQINPNVAPVYFNSLGKGSSIHQQLDKNEKIGSINMSYGVNVSYAINNKLSVKSGINRVDLGYSTDDIIVYENPQSTIRNIEIFKNIKLKNNVQNLTFFSGNDLGTAQSPAVIPDESLALLNQEMTYYEIPLEVKYKLSDKKVAFSLVGGFSTFLLSDNSVSYELSGEKTELGEAANLNNVSYSTNIGFGLDYNISKNINLNVDPMFKYQINTFNNTSGDFKPYFIGVYSGVSIKF